MGIPLCSTAGWGVYVAVGLTEWWLSSRSGVSPALSKTVVLLHTFQCAGHSVDLSGQFPQLGAVLEGVVEVLHKFFPGPLLWLLFGCGWWEPVFGHVPILVVSTLG